MNDLLNNPLAIINNTNSVVKNDSYKCINYKFGEYNIGVKLNDKNEFVGIENISVNKIFYTHSNVKAESDVSKYYEE